MKNIYEMSVEEKSKYRREFNKLSFTKDINKVRMPLLIIVIFGTIISGCLSAVMEDGKYNFTNIIQILDNFVPIIFLLFFVFTVYLNICFYRWLKIKHDVEY